MLLLDEPTNGLDLPSRARTEEALESYAGTLLLVSYDRYLVRRLAPRLLVMDRGKVEPFAGNYEAFLNRRQRERVQEAADLRLLLETRLAQLPAQLASPSEGGAVRLTEEFLRLSRELRALE